MRFTSTLGRHAFHATDNSGREATAQTVRRDATDNMMNSDERDFHPPVSTFKIMRYIFADHESSLNSFDVPRSWIWNLVKQIVYFGTSVSTIFKYDQQFKIIKWVILLIQIIN